MALVALLDIGSTKVRAWLVSPTADFPRIVSAVNVDLVLAARSDSTRFFDEVAAGAKTALQLLLQSGQGTPERVICFLASPFYAARTKVLVKREAAPCVCSPALLDEWLKAETVATVGHEVLESSVMDVSLDGYRLASPFGHRAREIEVSHYLSIAAEPLLSRLRAALAGVARTPELQFHSFAFAFFRVLDLLTAPGKNYLALEFNHELSELSLVWQDSLRETVSFPFGEDWLVREVGQTLQLTPAAARSFLQASTAAHIAPAAEEKLRRALKSLRPEWLRVFRAALDRALTDSLMPGELFFLGAPAVAPIIKRWLEEEAWHNLALDSDRLKVRIIDRVSFASRYNRLPQSLDISTLVEVIFYDTILTNVPRY